MKSQAKVKFVIFLAITIILGLIALSIFSLVKISQAQKEIASQSQQIEQLEKELDYYKEKI